MQWLKSRSVCEQILNCFMCIPERQQTSQKFNLISAGITCLVKLHLKRVHMDVVASGHGGTIHLSRFEDSKIGA